MQAANGVDWYAMQQHAEAPAFEEDVRGQQWIAIHGDPAVERKPVFEDGKPVYDGENVRTVSVESVR